MARGESGRIVIEIDPSLKAQLHDALTSTGSTMKSWFLNEARKYLAGSRPAALRVSEPQRGYRAKPKREVAE